METNSGVVWANPSVDWTTMTFREKDSRNAVALLANDWLEAALVMGYRCFLWEQHGFQGWECHSFRYGIRHDMDYLALKSETANAQWATYLPYASHVSRCDLCVTVKFSEPQPQLISELYEKIENSEENFAKARAYAIIESLLGGDTLYIGKRASAHFGRIYDKAIESADALFENCIRYEVEVKKPYADPVARALHSSPDGRAYIASYVAEWFKVRGVEVPWIPENAHDAIEIPRAATDDERSLKWLERSVSSTVRRLLSKGLESEVKKALGLALFSDDEE